MKQYCGEKEAEKCDGVECSADSQCLRVRQCGKCGTCPSDCDIQPVIKEDDIGPDSKDKYNQMQSTSGYFQEIQPLLPHIQYLDR